jgi:hypothetical protein
MEWIRLLGLETFIKKWENMASVDATSQDEHSTSDGVSTTATKTIVTSRRTFGAGDYEATAGSQSEGGDGGDENDEEVGGGATASAVILLVGRVSTAIKNSDDGGGTDSDFCASDNAEEASAATLISEEKGKEEEEEGAPREEAEVENEIIRLTQAQVQS